MAVPLIAACGSEANIGTINNFSLDDVPETCKEELKRDVIAYDRVNITSIPQNAPVGDEMYYFKDIMTNYRAELVAIMALPYSDDTVHLFPMGIDPIVEEVDFGEEPLAFENGNFMVSADFGNRPPTDTPMSLIITDRECSSFFGYAGYHIITGYDQRIDIDLRFYMDENGQIVEL